VKKGYIGKGAKKKKSPSKISESRDSGPLTKKGVGMFSMVKIKRRSFSGVWQVEV